MAPTRCRRRELLVTTEMALQEDGCCLLQVETLGVSHPDQGYAATRAFYSSVRFSPLEETHELWPGSPCLIMVKPLPAPVSAPHTDNPRSESIASSRVSTAGQGISGLLIHRSTSPCNHAYS